MHLTMPEKKGAAKKLPAILLLSFLGLAAAGAAYWYYSGRLSFEGVLRSNITTLLAERGGAVASVEVTPGRYVRKGDVLLRFDETALRRSLVAEREKLAQVEQLLPPEHLRRPAPGGGGSETLTDRLDRQRGDEDAATRRLQEATDREAQASVVYSRASILAAQGKLTPGERDAAEAALAAARHETEAAKTAFEALSLDRAATGTDITRIKSAQRASGADALPVEQRLSVYRQQLARVAEAEAAIQGAFVKAPDDGFVMAVAVRPGDTVPPMFPIAVFRSAAALPMVTAEVSEAVRRQLRSGQPCLVRLDGRDGSRGTLDGYVAYIAPPMQQRLEQGEKEASPAAGVWVALTPGAAITDQALADILLLDDGAQAEVTVLLREPLHSVPAPELPARAEDTPTSPPTAVPVTAPAGQAMPPASPLSVQTPFGQLPEQTTPAQPPARPEPPVVRAGSPEAAGKSPQQQVPPPAVQLPAMQAPPYPPSSSPLPERGNNPSLATPEGLQRMGESPR